MSEKQSWMEWGKDWITWAAKKTLPATAVEVVEKLLAPEKGDTTDYSQIDSHIKACESKLSKIPEDLEYVDINDLQKMYSLKNEADKSLKKAHKALESMSVSQMEEKGNNGLVKRRFFTEKHSTQLFDIEETLNCMAHTLFDQKIRPVEEQIKVIKQLTRKATMMGKTSFVRECQQIQIAVEEAEVRLQAAQDMFDAIPTKGEAQTMKDKLLSKEKEIISAKEQFEQGKVDLCKREMKTIDKKVKVINERVRAAQAKDPKVEMSDNFTQECANIRSTITEVEKYQEEIQDMLDALPTSDEMENMKEELAGKEKNVEEATKQVEAEILRAKKQVKVDECKQKMKKNNKKIKGIKQRARAAQMQNPNVRKTDNFARECAKMHEELEKIESCQQEIQDMLDDLPTSDEMENLREELEENVDEATKLVETEIQRAKEQGKVDECKQEMKKIDKKIKGIKQRARAAQMQNPKVRKTDNFARKCAKMREELEKIESCQQEIQDMLDDLPTSDEMENLKEELEENVKEATKLVEEAEHPPVQPISCVCAVM